MAATTHASLVALAIATPGVTTSRETLTSMSIQQLHMFLTSKGVQGYASAGEDTTSSYKSSKGGKGKFVPDNGTTALPGVVAPPPATTIPCTTLRTATQAQLIEALLAPLTTLDEVKALVDAIDAALDAKEAALAAAKPEAAIAEAKPLAIAPQEPEAPATPIEVQPEAMTPKAAERFVGKGGHNELRRAVQKHEGLAKLPQGTRECLLARLNAPAKAAKRITAPQCNDPIVHGVFDAEGKPMSLSAVRAAIAAVTAPLAKNAA
jgi:hypothetical protein